VRRLAVILDVDNAQVNPSRARKIRERVVDILICAGIPVLQVALHYIVQLNRYYINAINGCAESWDRSWPTIVIMMIWPLFFSIATAICARKLSHSHLFP
jgi:pheromone a factor receptor